MASHHHSCCRWLLASLCPCAQPPSPRFQRALRMFVVPAHLVMSDIIFRTQPPLPSLCLMVGPNSQVVCEIDPNLMTIVEDISEQYATCDECCPRPTQACCFPDGSCLDLPPAECRAQDGMPKGKRTTCLDFDCPTGECPIADSCADCPGTFLIEVQSVVMEATPGTLVWNRVLVSVSNLPPLCSWGGFGNSELYTVISVDMDRYFGPDGPNACDFIEHISDINIVTFATITCNANPPPGQPESWQISVGIRINDRSRFVCFNRVASNPSCPGGGYFRCDGTPDSLCGPGTCEPQSTDCFPLSSSVILS